MSSPITKTRSSRSISWAIASEMAFEVVSRRLVVSVVIFFSPIGLGEDAVDGRRWGRGWRAACERDRLGHLRPTGGPDLGGLLLAHHPGRGELALEADERIALRESVNLLLGAVQLRVTLEVAQQAVGLDLDQRRSGAAPRPRDGLAGGLVDRDRVVVGDEYPRDPVRGGAVAVVGDRGRRLLGHADCPLVVLAHEHNAQGPERREVQR